MNIVIKISQEILLNRPRRPLHGQDNTDFKKTVTCTDDGHLEHIHWSNLHFLLHGRQINNFQKENEVKKEEEIKTCTRPWC